MLLCWIIFLITAFSLGLAQKNCNRTRVVFPAPVFGAGDNLSYEGCGVWDQETNKYAPWLVFIRNSEGEPLCEGTLTSPTSILSHRCEYLAAEFEASEKKDDWKAQVGKCGPSIDYTACVANGEGQILKITNVTKLNSPGYPLHIWKIEKATLKENHLAPICISNIGNLHDFDKAQRFKAFDFEWDNSTKVSAKLLEDFDLCLNQSGRFKTCDKVHENFLCARLAKDYWYKLHLSHEEKNRHFLRAMMIESTGKRHVFYYDLFPLLKQIASASGDISLEPNK